MNRRTFLKLLSMIALLPRDFRLKQSDSPQFLIPPTTLHVTETSAVVYWWLPTTGLNAKLTLKGNDNSPRELSISDEKALVILDDLAPGVEYVYQVELNGQFPLYFDADWSTVRFTTPEPDAPMRFAVIGDSGYGDDVTLQLVAHMAAHEPDFLLHTGDMVYFSEAYGNDLPRNWALKFYLPFQPLLQQMPHYAAIGNHDNEAATRDANGLTFYYTAYPPLLDMPTFEERRSWYSFRRGDVQFLSVNTQTFYNERGLAEQDAWLRERLADETARTNIIFSHIPFRTSSSVHPGDGNPSQSQWRDLFAAYADRIALVLNGHSHLYERLLIDRITHITTGGGSAVIYPVGDSHAAGSQFVTSQAHFVIVDIDNTALTAKAYGLDNSLLDEVRLEI
ncbi:MAG: metallophosphoesterase [Chloroflexi bacterium]|nr:metallophosphoesterase [Chloroflexota bacterium]